MILHVPKLNVKPLHCMPVRVLYYFTEQAAERTAPMKKILALAALCAFALPGCTQQPENFKRLTLTRINLVPQFHRASVSLFCLHGTTCFAVSQPIVERQAFLAADPFFLFSRPPAPRPVFSFLKGRLEIGGKRKMSMFVPPVRTFLSSRKGPSGAVSLRYTF